ncbi:hypothetical protein [Gilvimarinus sp. DA14]|uniref:hypothetical protein n=1 Tax=Gilvimarinus sp. DA14 TaxID=2956798 RepID=UPI0020B734D2|nr:hypothetical protein [Gilvimarinus sp. DA14]UTF60947.1 hypothetical protein NHM04_03870 [Gilvimarinus sp. DA14]
MFEFSLATSLGNKNLPKRFSLNMNTITIIIMLLVAAMVIGPVAMMRPSPAQKKREAIRAYAFKQGLGVSVRRVPRIATDLEEPPLLPTYSVKVKNGEAWALRRAPFSHESHLAQYWHFTQGRAASATEDFLCAYLPTLSKRVAAVTSASGELSVAWHESFAEADVDSLRGFLTALAKAENAELIRG